MHPIIRYELAKARITDLHRQAQRDAMVRALHRSGGTRPRLTADGARCEALFASGLQRSGSPGAGSVAEAIRAVVRQFGTRGCASPMAQEYGDHPQAAAERMRWVRSLLGLPPRIVSPPSPGGARSGGTTR